MDSGSSGVGWASRIVCAVLLVGMLPMAQAQDESVEQGQVTELAKDGDSTLIAIETFSPPKLKSSVNPRYPKKYQSSGREGWVTVSMMIDQQGKPYDVRVVGSSGDPKFEKETLRVVPRWRFEPATLGTEKIDAAVRNGISFALSGATGATPSFVRRYKKLVQAIKSAEQADAHELLISLDASSRNLYEQAYWNLCKYLFEQKWGSEKSAYVALRRATRLDNNRGFLPEHMLLNLLTTKFNLELRASRYARARATAESLLEREVDSEIRQQLTEKLREIDQLAFSEGAIVLPGRIDDSNYYGHTLLRRNFAFRSLRGDIAELRLHCDKGYVGFTFDEKMSYAVDPSYSDCYLNAIGTPGTTFELVELAASDSSRAAESALPEPPTPQARLSD